MGLDFVSKLVRGLVILIICLCNSGSKSKRAVARRNIANRLAAFAA